MGVEQGNFVGAVITDCADWNASGRQGVEFQRLFGVTPTFVGVDSYNGLEAGGNLVDLLDRLVKAPLADPNQEGVVLVNAAPRDGATKENYDNGTPFCFFWIGKILVASTFEEQSLALARDMGITDEVQLTDVPTVTAAAKEWGDLTDAQADTINNTQFRSLEYLQLLARWLLNGRDVPAETRSLADLRSPSNSVWLVDIFGNAKTTLTERDVDFQEGEEVELDDGEKATCHHRLTDVLDGETGLTHGSSGFGPNRFLEIVVGGRGNASERHGLAVGSPVLKDLVAV